MPKINPLYLEDDEFDELPSVERIKHKPNIEKVVPEKKVKSKRNALARDMKEFHEKEKAKGREREA